MLTRCDLCRQAEIEQLLGFASRIAFVVWHGAHQVRLEHFYSVIIGVSECFSSIVICVECFLSCVSWTGSDVERSGLCVPAGGSD